MDDQLLRGDVLGHAVLAVRNGGRRLGFMHFVSSDKLISSKSTVSRVSSSGNDTERRLELHELDAEDFELAMLSSGVVSVSEAILGCASISQEYLRRLVTARACRMMEGAGTLMVSTV